MCIQLMIYILDSDSLDQAKTMLATMPIWQRGKILILKVWIYLKRCFFFKIFLIFIPWFLWRSFSKLQAGKATEQYPTSLSEIRVGDRN